MSDKDLERARRAANVLDNPAFQEAFNSVREGYVQAMMACDAKDDLGRARYAFALRDLEIVQRHLRTALVKGQISLAESKEMETANPWKRMARGLV